MGVRYALAGWRPSAFSFLLATIGLIQSDAAVVRAESMQQRLLLETVTMADTISAPEIRAAAQWKLVRPLLGAEMRDDAFAQAMKLQEANPHTCILSLSTIAKHAAERNDAEQNDAEFALKSLHAARDVSLAAGGQYSYRVVELCLAIDRPLPEAIAIAQAMPAAQQSRAFGAIRDDLARRGRVDEAYQAAQTHLPRQPLLHQHRQIGYSCATVKHYDYHATHDYFGQTIAIIEKMPPSQERDSVISHLVSNLLYVTGEDKVTHKDLERAAQWAEKIQDANVRDAAKGQVLQRKIADAPIAELQQMLNQSKVREEKTAILSSLFSKLLAGDRIDEADELLEKKIAAIKEQPRPETLSAFGRFNDQTAIESQIWTHERLVVNALIKVGRTAEARKRIEAMHTLPGYPPRTLLGTQSNIRQAMLLKLEDYDAMKALYEEEHPDQMDGYSMMMADHMLQKGNLDQALQSMEPILAKSPEQVFPPQTTNYFSATLHENLAVALVKANRVDDALRLVNQVPEHERVVDVFESFGRSLIESGKQAELEDWLQRLPHQTAKVYARLGAFYAMDQRL